MLVGVSITRSGARFILPRAGVPVPEIAPADATHVSSLPLIEGFSSLFFRFIICLISLALQVLVSSAWTWYTAMVSAHEYFMEFTSAQNVLSSLFDLFTIPICVNACVYGCMRCDMQCLF